MTMRKIVLTAGCIIASLAVFGQSRAQNPAIYYSMGKYYYDNKVYLNAYKFLLGYKYLNLDLLDKPANKSALTSLDHVINYCEAQLRKGISESSTFNRRGWAEPNMDSINTIVREVPPELPARKIEM
jgi:hypothetical protein